MNWTETLLTILCRYFRIEIQGLEFIPNHGPGIIVANHSGWMGLDALLLSHLIQKRTGRRCRIMAHRGYFDWSKKIQELAFRRYLRRPSLKDACETLRHGHLLLVFPEGERGNFKSSLKRYRLQPFHKGFVQIALACRAPLIRCVILGAEESQLNLGSIRLGYRAAKLRIPLPVLLPPLPSRWRIELQTPIAPEKLQGFGDSPYSRAAGIAESVRCDLQARLDRLRTRT